MLGPGNTAAAKEALAIWPGGLQVGGGINDKNAKEWVDAGADKVRHFHIHGLDLKFH
jgi:phosphoribosylformimino-5-aminoimidazole carboxamide ribotide isomerase